MGSMSKLEKRLLEEGVKISNMNKFHEIMDLLFRQHIHLHGGIYNWNEFIELYENPPKMENDSISRDRYAQ